jgi:IS5 family transposase
LKKAMRACGRAAVSGGANKAERVKKEAETYVEVACAVEEKVEESIRILRSPEQALSLPQMIELQEAIGFQNHLIHHIDLVERRLILGESIPHEEKVFSLFEEHTELIKKGKARPPVEFGHRLLIYCCAS